MKTPERFKTQAAIGIIVIIGAAIFQGISAITRVTAQSTNTLYRVTRIVDGDTVYLESYPKSFRLIGIDTPESKRNARAKSIAARTGQDLETIIAQGKRASAYTKSLLEGKSVRIEWDVQPKDRYGRNLAYLWHGSKMVNLEIVRAGFADVLTIPPNVRYVEKFVQVAREAREQRRGLWR